MGSVRRGGSVGPSKKVFRFLGFLAPNRALRAIESPHVAGSIPAPATVSNLGNRNAYGVSPANRLRPSIAAPRRRPSALELPRATESNAPPGVLRPSRATGHSLYSRRAFTRVPEIVARLHVEPHLGAGARGALEAQRRRCADAGAAPRPRSTVCRRRPPLQRRPLTQSMTSRTSSSRPDAPAPRREPH
jgi:hypothetical protein